MDSNIGEMIAYAWLRRVKSCSFVNMNWRPVIVQKDEEFSEATTQLVKEAENVVTQFHGKLEKKKENQKGTDSKVRLDLVQTEIDAIGISLKPDSNQDQLEFHVVEVECHDHETGKGSEYFPVKVLKKYLRAAICLSEVVCGNCVDIYFITQSIAKRHEVNTIKAKDLANRFFKAYMPDFEAHLIYGDKFTTDVFEPLANKEQLELGKEAFTSFLAFYNSQDTKMSNEEEDA